MKGEQQKNMLSHDLSVIYTAYFCSATIQFSIIQQTVTMKILIVWILPMLTLGVLSNHSSDLSNISKGMITGCNKAEDGQFSYQVAITSKHQFLCSGSIIAPNYVLTSAYCIECATASNLFVQVGSTNLREMEIKRVKKIIMHERYDRWSRTSDIALLELQNPLELDDAVQTILLDNEDNEDNSDSVEATFAGWSKNSYVCDRLSYSNITIDSNDDCRHAMWNRLNEDQLCSLFDYNQAGCTDNGSPLVSNGKQVGIHSYVCSNRKVVYVYTKVSSYYDWIVQHTGIEEPHIPEE